MNSIPHEQNQLKQLEKLAAQRWLYTIAKRALAAEMIVTIPVPIILGIVVLVESSLKPMAAVISITIAMLVNFVLISHQRTQRTLAARVQESFDCAVLQMPWNNLLTGGPTDLDTYRRVRIQTEKWFP